MNQKVLCIGTLVVDIVNDAIPRRLNAWEGISTVFEIHLGGNAYNVAIDLKQLGWQQGPIACLGAVGNDYFGELFQLGLKNQGVLPVVCLVPGASTSKNIVLQVEGEELRHHYDGSANGLLGLDFVINWIREFQPDLLYIGEIGLLGETGKNLKKILETAKEKNCITVVDILILPNEDRSYLSEAAHLIDVFHCNDFEARLLTGKTDMREITEKLLELGIELPLVSLGEKGLVCSFDGFYHTFPAFKVRSTDPTGAGDAFTAGFIKKLLELEGATSKDKLSGSRAKLLDAIHLGMAAGACCVTDLGCTQAVREAKVVELLESQSRNTLNAVTSVAL